MNMPVIANQLGQTLLSERTPPVKPNAGIQQRALCD